jgi:hypothetical protein
MEGRVPHATTGPADPFELLEQSCRLDGSRLLLSEPDGTFVPLLRQIDRLTSRLANQISMEMDWPESAG